MELRAEEYLEQYKKLGEIIKNKQGQVVRLKGVADGMGGGALSADRVQSSRNLHRGADAIGNYIDLEREIKELEARQEDILNTLERLPFIEYKILYMLFIDTYMLKEIPSEFHKSYAWAKKRKQNGLKLLQKILDEKKG